MKLILNYKRIDSKYFHLFSYTKYSSTFIPFEKLVLKFTHFFQKNHFKLYK